MINFYSALPADAGGKRPVGAGSRGQDLPGPAPSSTSPFLPPSPATGWADPRGPRRSNEVVCPSQGARPQWDLLSNVVYMLPGFIFSFRERSSSVRSYIPQPGPAVWGFTGRFHNHSKPRSSSPEVPAPRRPPSPQPFTPTPTFIKSLGDFPENGLIAMWGLTAVSLKHKSPCKASGPHCQAWAAHL